MAIVCKQLFYTNFIAIFVLFENTFCAKYNPQSFMYKVLGRVGVINFDWDQELITVLLATASRGV